MNLENCGLHSLFLLLTFSLAFLLKIFGAGEGARTLNHLIKSQVRYHYATPAGLSVFPECHCSAVTNLPNVGFEPTSPQITRRILPVVLIRHMVQG